MGFKRLLTTEDLDAINQRIDDLAQAINSLNEKVDIILTGSDERPVGINLRVDTPSN